MAELKSTSEMNRVLGKKELFSVATGQIIGAGIFALAGIGIGMTGRSVNLSFLIAAVLVVMLSLPTILIGGTIRMRGGQYTQAGLFLGEKFAGAYMIIFVFTNLSLAMYAISFADYFLAIVPGVSSKLIAFIMLTVFYVLNMFGVKGAAKLQNLMVLVMSVALGLFIAFGVKEINPGYFQQPGFITNGMRGVFTAGALLTFATGGAQVVINLGAESKNPTKDVPFVIIASTLSIAGVYAFMSTVAAGVLPIEEVAYQPLSLVAAEILPAPVYVFFIVGGAMFALSTTLNATLGWVTKPLLQATVDGWFPKVLSKTTKKNKVPFVLLTIFYLIGAIPILTGWNIGALANFVMVLYNFIFIFLSIAVIRIDKVIPEIWKYSKWKVSKPVLYACGLLGALAGGIQVFLLITDATINQAIGNVIILSFAIVYAHFRQKTGNINMEISYEEA